MASRGFVATIVALLLGLGLVLSGCAQGPVAGPSGRDDITPTPTVSTPAGQTPSATASPAGTRGPGPQGGGAGAPDGPEDPEQGRIRSGPVASFGGPSHGDRGTEVWSGGTWCTTVGVFWGGEAPVPADVTFRLDKAVTSPWGGLDVLPGICGTQDADRTCIGLVLPGDVADVTCSLVLRPRAGFIDGTEITFEGTLTCPTIAVCDRMKTRTVTPGPPIIIHRPEGEWPRPDAGASETPEPGAGSSETPESGTGSSETAGPGASVEATAS